MFYIFTHSLTKSNRLWNINLDSLEKYMGDKPLWIRHYKRMMLYSFNYMLLTKEWIRIELRYYDSELGNPEKIVEAVDEYVSARDDYLSWKKQLLEEYGWKK